LRPFSHARDAELAGEGIHFLGDLSEFLILLKSLDKIDEFLTLLFLDLD